MEYGDGKNKNSIFYALLSQIGGLSLMKRRRSETEGGKLRSAPFIMTCVTATCFGPIETFLADSHRMRVYLPLNRLSAPTWKKDNSLVLDNSPAARLLVNDVGGHARAIELIADELNKYQDGLQPNIAESSKQKGVLLACLLISKSGHEYHRVEWSLSPCQRISRPQM